MTSSGRPRLAVAWASGCGGCEMAFLDLGDRLLELADTFELVYFPLLLDVRRSSLEDLSDDAIDVALVSGAIRTSDDAELVRLLRRVARRLVALGACAHLGSVLALADLVPVPRLLATVYGEDGEQSRAPGGTASVGAGTLELATLTSSVRPIAGVAPVDLVIPGCPPESGTLRASLERLAEMAAEPPEPLHPAPPLGCDAVTVCEQCGRRRPSGGLPGFVRAHTRVPDPESCLLDQGLVCVGPATLGGCGAPCPAAGAGCRGCYGPPVGVDDQGAQASAALAAALRAGADDDDDDSARRAVQGAAATLADPVGTLYRYSFASSLLALLGRGTGGSKCGG